MGCCFTVWRPQPETQVCKIRIEQRTLLENVLELGEAVFHSKALNSYDGRAVSLCCRGKATITAEPLTELHAPHSPQSNPPLCQWRCLPEAIQEE